MVLTVEDDVISRRILKFNIELCTHMSAVEAVDGVDGLNRYNKNKDGIYLIATDIMMPNMDGIEMAKEIRKIDAKIPIIFISALNEMEIKIPYTWLIPKPLEQKLLKETLAEINGHVYL